MTFISWFLVAVFGLAAAVFVAGLFTAPRSRVQALEARYLSLLRLPPAEARAQLRERVEALAERFPNHHLEWYLDWLVTDLERAKR